jgi:uncharacterized protein YodC (DUF2158 family)
MPRKAGEGNKFAIGDSVQLRSGGPVMTITAVHELSDGTSYSTSWFAGRKHEHSRFPENAMMIAVEEKEK